MDLPFVDAIEIYNTADQEVDISGWLLSGSHSGDRLGTFEFPSSTIIPAGGFLTIDEIDFNPAPGTPGPNDFELDGAHGGLVWLVENDGCGHEIVSADTVEYGAQFNGESWGRWPNGTGILYPMTNLTLNAENSGPRIGPVVISEIHYHPLVGQGEFEFLEIYNPTNASVDLTEWRIRGGVDYDFEASTFLDDSGVLVVLSFDPADPANATRLEAFRSHYSIDDSVRLVGGYSGQLSNGGETVRLERPDQPPWGEPDFYPHVLEDQTRYDDRGPWPEAADGDGASLGRELPPQWGHDADRWYAGTPTPGRVITTPQVTIVEFNAGQADPLDLATGAQPSRWKAQRSDIRSIVVTFSEEVVVSESDLVLTHLGMNAPVDVDTVITLTDDHQAFTGQVLSLRFAPHELPDGVYSLEVLPTVTDLDGNPLDGNADGQGGDSYILVGNSTNTFSKVTGDWNGDGGVSIFDFPTFAYWFGKSIPTAPDYVDLNGDAGITIFDFPAFASNFGVGVTFPTAIVTTNFAAAPSSLKDPNEPRRPGGRSFHVLEESAERQSAVGLSPLIEFRPKDGEAKVLKTDSEQPELEQVLDEIGADVFSAWNQL